MIGAHEDAKREARAIPVGREDAFRAEIFNRLWKAIRRQTDADFADAEAFEKGCIGGVGYTVVDVNPKPGNPLFVDFVIDPVHPFEILVDPQAIPQPTGDVAAMSGETWSFQGWFRDSVGGTAVSNLTEGIAITF